MAQPFRRYTYILSERLSMTRQQLLSVTDCDDIFEWMAFDLTKDQDWVDKYEKNKQAERIKSQGQAEINEQLKNMFMNLGKR